MNIHILQIYLRQLPGSVFNIMAVGRSAFVRDARKQCISKKTKNKCLPLTTKVNLNNYYTVKSDRAGK